MKKKKRLVFGLPFISENNIYTVINFTKEIFKIRLLLQMEILDTGPFSTKPQIDPRKYPYQLF